MVQPWMAGQAVGSETGAETDYPSPARDGSITWPLTPRPVPLEQIIWII